MQNDKIKVNILVCHHKESDYIKTECLIPIQVGRAIAPYKLDYCIGDDTGDNISHKNKNWCELTAMYWQWKNVDADYYGLFHYRRYLSFRHEKSFYSEENLNESVLNKHGLHNGTIKETCKSNAIIFSTRDKVYQTLNSGKPLTIYEQYCEEHYRKDIDDLLLIIKNDYSAYYLTAQQIMNSYECSFGNLIIMRKDYYHEYCEFLFGVLEKLEKQIDIFEYDLYQRRVFGFLAERLTNIYLQKKIDENFSYKEQSVIFLCESKKQNIEMLKRNFLTKKSLHVSSDIINICMSFDDNYFIHALTAFNSLLNNTSEQNKFKLFVLCNNKLSFSNRERFSKFLSSKNVNINYLDIDERIFENFPLNMGYISITTYYRLILDKILPIDRVIYLDADIIVLSDIVELWDTNLQHNSIAVVYDELGLIQERRLGFDNNQVYFNAGVMIFDLKNIRIKYDNKIFENYLKIFKEREEDILFQDQDILNIAFKEDKYLLPLKWNIGTGTFIPNMNERRYNSADEKEAVQNAGIIHFTGGNKPWKFLYNHPVDFVYWYFRLKLLSKLYLTKREIPNYLNHSFVKLGYRSSGNKLSITFKNKELFDVDKETAREILRILKKLKVKQ